MDLCCEKDVRQALLGLPFQTYKAYLATEETSFSEVFPNILANAESFIASFCHFDFKYHSETKWYPGNSKNQLPVEVWPIIQVNTCMVHLLPYVYWYKFQRPCNINCVDSNGITVATPATDTEIQDTDLLVDCSNGLLNIPPTIKYLSMSNYLPGWNYVWLSVDGGPNIEINFDFGYTDATLPQAIRTCAANLCALQILPQIDSIMSAGQTSWGIGDERRQWGRSARPSPTTPSEFAQFAYEGMYSTQAHSLLNFIAGTLPKFRRVSLGIGQMRI